MNDIQSEGFKVIRFADFIEPSCPWRYDQEEQSYLCNCIIDDTGDFSYGKDLKLK